jgi:hypothetical protein
MPSEIKIYKINEFVRMNESGEIDFDKSIQIVRALSAAASFNPSHNVLIDLRDTTVANANIGQLMEVVLEFVKCMPLSFKNKIASVVPGDQERVSKAKLFEASMKAHGFQYSFFTSFEDAIEWFSDIKT